MAITIETDDLVVEFEITDESFDHEFGNQKAYSHKVIKVEAYAPAIDAWIDVTDNHKFFDLTELLIQKELEKTYDEVVGNY